MSFAFGPSEPCNANLVYREAGRAGGVASLGGDRNLAGLRPSRHRRCHPGVGVHREAGRCHSAKGHLRHLRQAGPSKDDRSATGPLAGLNVLSVGVTLKAGLLVRLPDGIFTTTEPVRAPAGTVAVR
jgi:hypothetical protein